MTFALPLAAAVPSAGVRELLIPTYPAIAVYGEALAASNISSAFVVNPSLMARQSYPCFSTTHTEWFAGTRKERLDFCYPNSWGTIGVGASGFHIWDMEARSDSNSTPQPFSAYNMSLELRYARGIGNFSIGASAAAFLEHIYNYSGWGFASSLGASYSLKPFLFGLSVLNLGPPVKLNTGFESTPLPLEIQFGASASPIVLSTPLDIQVGAMWEPSSAGGSFDFTLGLGTTVLKILRLDLAGGYGAHTHAGAGMAIKLKNVEVAYSASLRPSIGFTHHIGLDIVLPPSEKVDPIVAKMMQTSQTFVEIGKRDMLNKDYVHALAQFDLALIWYPDNVEAEQGYEEALSKEREKQISVHLEAARLERESGNYLDALREYEYVLSQAPDNALALSGRADMLLKLQETPMLTKTDIPQEAVNFFEAGVEAFRKDNFTEALKFWEEISDNYSYIEEISPFIKLASDRRSTQIDSLLRLAYDARERGALRQALNITEKVISVDPTNNMAHSLREELTALVHRKVSELLEEALGYFDSRRYEQAAERFNDILTLEPSNAIASRYLERIRKEERLGREDLASLNVTAAGAYALGDYDTAIRIWEQILSVDSTFANVKRNLDRARHKKSLLSNP